MIALHTLWLLVAAAVFLLLRKRRLLTRLLISASVFALLSGVSMYLVFKWAGEPLDGSVPVSEEVLKKEGKMSQEEWEEYKRSLPEEEANPDKND